MDKTGYTYNGKPLGDHYPVVATFEVMVKGYTGIESIVPADTDDATYYNLNGQRVSKPQRGVYVVNGKKVVVK